MDQKVQKINNNKCRTCLQKSKNLLALSKFAIDGNVKQISYADLLKEVTNINIEDDNLAKMPQYICGCCSRKLKSSHSFIKKAQEANEQLWRLLKNGDKDCLQESEIDIQNCLEIKIENDEEIGSYECIQKSVETSEDQLVLKKEDPDELALKENTKQSNEAKEIMGTLTLTVDQIGLETESSKGNTNCLENMELLMKGDKNRTFAESENSETSHLSPHIHENSDDGETSLSDCEEDTEYFPSNVSTNTKTKFKLFENRKEEDNDIPIPCAKCNKIFDNSKELSRHLSYAHPPEDQKCACPVCGLKYSRAGTMYQHMRKFHDPESISKFLPPRSEKTAQCDHCPRKYASKKELNFHIKKKHTKNGEIVKEEENMAEETTQKTKNEVRALCSICGASAANKAQLVIHMRRHTGERPFKCNQCERAFPRKTELIYHQRLHSGEKPYRCKICEKTFRVASKLSSHMRSHSGERPYKCSQCERSFKYSKDLNIHNRIHTGERPYCCTVCGSTFTQSNSLKAHRVNLGHL